MLAARGSELEREFPFGVVRQLFEPALADPAAGATARRRRGAARPRLRARSSPTPASDASFAALHGLYWLTAQPRRASGRCCSPSTTCTGATGPSLRFLAYLARRLEGLPVLLLAGLREAEPGTDPR